MEKRRHQVLEVEALTPETFVIHLDRQDFSFQSGQYAILRNPETGEGREYSIYSAVNDDRLSFLVREIEDGEFSRYLKHLTPGSPIELDGPRGFFILDEQSLNGKPLLFVATGTGISPFHSFVLSHPGLNYQVLHGVHFADEAYGQPVFDASRFCLCTSREEEGNYFGRVSYYLKEHTIATETICYLCGNSDMIEEVTGILENQGIAPENIRTEVFF
ncbi:ferredoxin--NADP reductase [Sunxiuqinia elliptica]|uniref:Ferredoxin--NADP+ reductase n=1 Tax=Sunxiuqinia elliptica TaxID=655355 RepID=A0A1I2JD06_9BACT|nr:FAD-binding oxidoreductase [Sunxiuqinia elliptica]SFF52424.1 ferredoxin--NADP+ reductase [Sunxiuqinia elliptica]